MYEIRKGENCVVVVTLVEASGAVVNLRNAQDIQAVLHLPSDATMDCSRLYFDEVTQRIYVCLSAERELTAEGTYGMNINALFDEERLLTTPVFEFAEVKADVESRDEVLEIELRVSITEVPKCVRYTGASPKISERGTWLVFDDELNAFVDTGIAAGAVLIEPAFVRGEGASSAVTGIGTEAKNVAEVAIGKYNKSDEGTMFSVGNGASEDARRNAFEVRGARPLSATAYRLDIESGEETIYAYNVKLAYVGQREDYNGEGDTNDAYIIYSSDGDVGVGTIVTIKVDAWDANDPTRSASIRWVRDYKGEHDYIQSNRLDFLAQVVVTRTLAEALVADNLVATTPSGDPMHYAYELEGAVWQPEEMLWSLNGIYDLTTEEVRAIYAERFVGNNHSIMSSWWAATQQRTNMCRASNGSALSIANAFIHSRSIEAATLGTAVFYSWKSVFQNCSALRSVVGELNWKYMTASSHIDANVFKGCTSLEEVRIKDLKQSVSFADSPRLSKASVLFIIQNASPTSAITITFHEDVYDACAEDSDIQAALAVKTLVTLGI